MVLQRVKMRLMEIAIESVWSLHFAKRHMKEATGRIQFAFQNMAASKGKQSDAKRFVSVTRRDNQWVKGTASGKAAYELRAFPGSL